MKHALPLLLGFALGSQSALAADGLLLRLKQSSQRGISNYELLQAQRGDFSASPNLTDEQDNGVLLIGRDRQGRELFRSRQSNPGILQAESWNPKTGQIEHAQTISLPQAYFEVRLPQAAQLDSLEVQTLDGKGRSLSSAGQRFSRSQLDRALRAGSLSQMGLKQQAASTVLYESGASSNRMDLVLIGDGYTAAEQAKWVSDARKVADGILADPLFAANKSRLNIRRVDVVSRESGIDELDKGIYRDTALGMEAGCYNIERLICANDNLVFNAVGAATSADARDVILAVANTTRYGGAGGAIGTMTMNAQALEVALHEIGHTAFKLADEYDYGTCSNSSEPSEANVTIQTNRANIKWGSQIGSTILLPTPTGYHPNGTIGLFRGAKYCTSGMYRPTENSRMRALGQPWHAINEQRANQVFASYGGGGSDGSWITQTGSLATGKTVNLPSSITSRGAGSYKVQLTGPAGADFDLFLFKWNGSSWAQVAKSDSPNPNESIDYNGSAGYYYFQIKADSGSGNYSVRYSFPK